MALTLNGIAQGYITDRVADVLRTAGLRHCLVDMGEIRALGPRRGGAAWRLGLEDPVFPGKVSRQMALMDGAVATSGAYGLRFDADGQFNHLFDPRTGECSCRYLSVSVFAPSATQADALSTALSLMPLEQARPVIERFAAGATFTMPDGSRVDLGRPMDPTATLAAR